MKWVRERENKKTRASIRNLSLSLSLYFHVFVVIRSQTSWLDFLYFFIFLHPIIVGCGDAHRRHSCRCCYCERSVQFKTTKSKTSLYFFFLLLLLYFCYCFVLLYVWKLDYRFLFCCCCCCSLYKEVTYPNAIQPRLTSQI